MLMAHPQNDEKVNRFIRANFVENVQVEKYPMVPGGRVLTDKNEDKMLVYVDPGKDCVSYLFL